VAVRGGSPAQRLGGALQLLRRGPPLGGLGPRLGRRALAAPLAPATSLAATSLEATARRARRLAGRRLARSEHAVGAAAGDPLLGGGPRRRLLHKRGQEAAQGALEGVGVGAGAEQLREHLPLARLARLQAAAPAGQLRFADGLRSAPGRPAARGVAGAAGAVGEECRDVRRGAERRAAEQRRLLGRERLGGADGGIESVRQAKLLRVGRHGLHEHGVLEGDGDMAAAAGEGGAADRGARAARQLLGDVPPQGV